MGRRLTLSAQASPYHQYHPPPSSLVAGRSPQLPARFRHPGYHGDGNQPLHGIIAQCELMRERGGREGRREGRTKGIVFIRYM